MLIQMTQTIAALVNLNSRDHYYHWGFILISKANLIVIIIMLVIFIAAITLPFLHIRQKNKSHSTYTKNNDEPDENDKKAEVETEGSEMWTVAARKIWLRFLPPKKLLPDSQPAYVSSWAYVFGVLTLSGLILVIISGLILAIKGPSWWHYSSIGHFVNSVHLWSVELFLAFMAIHLWLKFWMAAWRGKRKLTWMTGVLAFVISLVEAFTGYLSQTNFDSQWIAFESKDAFNGGGIGAIVNPMNFGQALMLHIALIPLILIALVAVHVILVRLRGVVHPINRKSREDFIAERKKIIHAREANVMSNEGE